MGKNILEIVTEQLIVASAPSVCPRNLLAYKLPPDQHSSMQALAVVTKKASFPGLLLERSPLHDSTHLTNLR